MKVKRFRIWAYRLEGKPAYAKIVDKSNFEIAAGPLVSDKDLSLKKGTDYAQPGELAKVALNPWGPGVLTEAEKKRIAEGARKMMEAAGKWLDELTRIKVNGTMLARDWLGKILTVISNQEKDFGWKKITSSNQVGIAGFKGNDLKVLYKRMNTQTYFGKTADKVPSSGSSAWKAGIKKFLESGESQGVQAVAFLDLVRPEIEKAEAKGAKSDRTLAIAALARHQLGKSSFEKVASSAKWKMDSVLGKCGQASSRCKTRAKILEALFAKP
jgi:hypothetical protein